MTNFFSKNYRHWLILLFHIKFLAHMDFVKQQDSYMDNYAVTSQADSCLTVIFPTPIDASLIFRSFHQNQYAWYSGIKNIEEQAENKPNDPKHCG